MSIADIMSGTNNDLKIKEFLNPQRIAWSGLGILIVNIFIAVKWK